MKNRKILIGLLSLILVTLILLFIDKSTIKEYSRDYFYMDTYINVKVSSYKNKKEIDNIFNDIDYIYKEYHKLTDRYNKYDDVYNIYYLNELLENDKEIEIDGKLMDIIKLGREYYDKTGGLFNIASGNLTIIYNEFINTCDKKFDYDLSNVNTNINDIFLNKNIYKKTNDIKLDLGGISKGYTTNLVSKYLVSKGINSYVINAGGNVVVGKPLEKDNYSIGITDPNKKGSVYTVLNLTNKSIVTSGNYERYCIYDDILYSHIINPLTKKPSNYFKSVTVVTDDSAISDIYSTYLYMLPLEEGLELVNNNSSIEAIWYTNDDNIVRSKGFNYE